MKKEKFNIVNLVNNSGCFDLQFRKDTRHKRTNSPTYYRWKIQFVITLPKLEIEELKKAASLISCGNITVTGNQARLSVQNIDEIYEAVIPYFKKNLLAGEKKKDFSIWQKAVEIVYKNKGKKITTWEKSDLSSLIEIHKLSAKYKGRTHSGKWINMARTLTR